VSVAERASPPIEASVTDWQRELTVQSTKPHVTSSASWLSRIGMTTIPFMGQS
tara:strand:+ start:569 stop:727 length:159 start_codon:yes stop_codon:yes gene_type:complete